MIEGVLVGYAIAYGANDYEYVIVGPGFIGICQEYINHAFVVLGGLAGAGVGFTGGSLRGVVRLLS